MHSNRRSLSLFSIALGFVLACSDDGVVEGKDDNGGSSDEIGDTETGTGESGSTGTSTDTGSGMTDDSVWTDSSSTDTGMTDTGSTDTGSTDTGSTDTGSAGTGTDTGTDTTGDLDAPWLLHVRNDTDRLVKIDTDTGVETVVCDFAGDANYPSITFGIGGELFGSRGGSQLDLIDPCTCEVTNVGNMGFTGVNGITANGLEILRLYGISINSDVLLDISTMNAMSMVVGNGLGINIGYSGSTWSSDILGLYAINADDDKLYEVDVGTGLASAVVDLDVNFVTVGIEWHPDNGVLYGCTDGHLYSIDPETGTTSEIGNMGHGCNNLAAPWTYVACIENL